MNRLRIATRASKLALWQAEWVRSALARAYPHLPVELITVVSTGDVNTQRPLHEFGGVGVFTKEVQDAVLDGRADLAVHSLKDLPTLPHPDLLLAAVPQRGPVHDILLSPRYETLDRLPPGATVATGSPRRRAQLLRHRPDLRIMPIRGNIDTRIRKLHDEPFDALVLAAAGPARLEIVGETMTPIATEILLPAVGQGALGIECRAGDAATIALLACLQDDQTRRVVDAERSFMRTLQGGCHVPVAAFADIDSQGQLRLRGMVLDLDGRHCFAGEQIGAVSDAEALGHSLAEQLLRAGAGALLGQGDANQH